MAAKKSSKDSMKFSWGAAVLITLGVVFLLANFGFLSNDIWQIFGVIWPIFLILAGIHILYHRKAS